MALWLEILQRLVGNYQNKEKFKKVNLVFPRSPPKRYSGERIQRNSPVPPQKDTLVRKFPLFPHKGYSGEINLSLPDFFYAEPGGPPFREYIPPMAMYETSPHPGSIKKKIRN